MSLEQLDQLAQKVSQAMFLIQKLRAENASLESKVQEQGSKIDSLELDIMSKEEEIDGLKNTLSDRESRLNEQNSKMDDAAERLHRMLSALNGLDVNTSNSSEESSVQTTESTDEVSADFSFEPENSNPQQALF